MISTFSFDAADGPGVVLACRSRKIGDGIGGMGDGLRLQPAGFVKAPAQAGLPAFFMHRPHVVPGHIGHQQLDRVGADINDRAANRFHGASDYAARLGNPK